MHLSKRFMHSRAKDQRTRNEIRLSLEYVFEFECSKTHLILLDLRPRDVRPPRNALGNCCWCASPVRDSRRSDAFVGVIMSETSPAPLAILFVDF